jgi:hypothetical protein
LDNRELLNLIGVSECSYQTLEEFRSDPDNLFTSEQKMKLECIKQIALELQSSTGVGDKSIDREGGAHE